MNNTETCLSENYVNSLTVSKLEKLGRVFIWQDSNSLCIMTESLIAAY